MSDAEKAKGKDEDKDKEEIERFILFTKSIGILLFWLKKKDCYVPGLIILVLCSILGLTLGTTPVKSGKDVLNLFKNEDYALIVKGINILILLFLLRTYYKYKEYIDSKSKSGKFKSYTNQIIIILIAILLVEIFYLYSNKEDNKKQMLFAFGLYVLSMRLLLVTVNLYSKSRYSNN